MMKLIFAPDSFKGSLSSMEICRIMEQAAHEELDCETISVPIADGGEGTVDALVAACRGVKGKCAVTGPLYSRTEAEYGLIHGGRTAVVEMAQASGLPLVPRKKRDPLKTTSRGTGEVLRYLLETGVRDFLIGVGGSATNDGGMGLLEALGVVFRDAQGEALGGCGENLIRVASIDLSGLDPRLNDSSIRVMCDVTNPLLGLQGATYIYGPQKGGTPQTLELLEAGMRHYSGVFAGMGIDIAGFQGAGAAGGVGGALIGVLPAEMLKGVDAVLKTVQFESLLKDASLVFTGEGRLDGQSVRYGKVPQGVAELCARYRVPVIAFVGGLGEGANDFLNAGLTSMVAIPDGPMTLEQSIADTPRLLHDAVVRALRMVKMGAVSAAKGGN